MAARKKGIRTRTSTGKTRYVTKARRGAPKANQKARHNYYRKHRIKFLKYARTYYRRHRAKVLKRAARYRKLTNNGRNPFYKSGRAGGKIHRFKRLPRIHKYTRIGGGRTRRRSSGRRRRA
jgi:hypothetical protein